MAPAEIAVQVVYCAAAGEADCSDLRLPESTTVAMALAASGVLQRHPELGAAPAVGVWARMQPLDHPLRDRDRVEIYRPLTVDPKEARRLRYKRQKNEKGAKSEKGETGETTRISGNRAK